ncbi:MAG: hypothetical protein IT580_02110, partial [Verrucomicrobiales bacterium]|nr:hypothetical protein [Verrucomicrobiales bacterium]
MKRAANWRMGWVVVTVAMVCFLGAGALALRAQDAEPTPAGETTPAEPRREASASATPERQRLREIVKIGGSARVRADQVADEVVVVRGDAQIEGEVDGDVVVVLGKLTLTGTVRGSVVVVLGEADIRGSIRDEAVFV